MSSSNCPLCDRAVKSRPLANSDDRTRYECSTCGTFSIDGITEHAGLIDQQTRSRRYLLSAYVKNNKNVIITNNFLDQLGMGELRERTVEEKIELAVRWFADKSTEFGQKIPSNPASDYPVAWCRRPEEWQGLLGALTNELKFVIFDHPCYRLSMEGWRWLSNKPGEPSSDAFIAMNFNSRFLPVRDAIQLAIKSAGYNPIIINQDFFHGGIMDRVLARIRQSKFIVADYTGNRGGVYYEAGFASGLGKPVISTCDLVQLDSPNKDDRLHFDVAHLKMITWQADKLTDFADNLKEHILAIFGQGSANPTV